LFADIFALGGTGCHFDIARGTEVPDCWSQ